MAGSNTLTVISQALSVPNIKAAKTNPIRVTHVTSGAEVAINFSTTL